MKHLLKFKTKAERDEYMAVTPLPAYPYVHYLEDSQDVLYSGPEVDLPFYIENVNNCVIKFTKTGLQCSSDGVTWSSLPSPYTFNYPGERLYIKATGLTTSSSTGIGTFTVTKGSFNIGGNIMSLVYGDDYRGQTVISQTYQFYKLFENCSTLRSARRLALPATTLTERCYSSMFSGCAGLVNAPALPATTLAIYCYSSMFSGCAGLVNAPALPATVLASNCYYYMFSGCASLVNAPALPATALATYCYGFMFRSCTSLVNAPALPATVLTSNCYAYMFNGCSSLNHIKAMFTTTPGSSYTESWVSGVASTGIFVKNRAATWTTTGTAGIPTGWTVELADA